MEKKINIAELLKDCPKGMELDCTMFDNVYFERVNENVDYPIRIKVGKADVVNLTKYGCWNKYSNAKCVIFPKGRDTWKGFQGPFKDGDIVSITIYPKGTWIAIFKQYQEASFVSHCSLNTSNQFQHFEISGHSLTGVHLATEEEKQKLFDAIKDNGYEWNAETKTLEKLVKPKFKVGDRVKHISAYTSGIVVKVDDKGYCINYPKGEGVCYINFALEKNYELAPNKFDITTLKPFDKVLVRLTNNCVWMPKFFFYYDTDSKMKYYPFITTDNIGYVQCIPYNDDTKHLLGKTNSCDEYYKNWE